MIQKQSHQEVSILLKRCPIPVKFLSGDAKLQNKFWGDWPQIFYPSHMC